MPFLSPIWKRLIRDAEFGARSRLKRSKSATKPRKLAVKRRLRKLKDPSTSSTKNTTLRKRGILRRTSKHRWFLLAFPHILPFFILSNMLVTTGNKGLTTSHPSPTPSQTERPGLAFATSSTSKILKARQLHEQVLVRLTWLGSKKSCWGWRGRVIRLLELLDTRLHKIARITFLFCNRMSILFFCFILLFHSPSN